MMKLGRYEVVQHLESGGMADVLLARTIGIEGFERHVVIKRIRAEQARDKRYVTMFLDEARLAASLHHANVVQVNDIGQEDGEYFLAMEYVHGEDARKLLNRTAAADERIPIGHVLSIVINAAAGLHHAHEQIRPDGVSLGIVHRDVSPANILVGYDGGVKVVDFGIAKAAHQAPETGADLLKGKLAYMSPEQCNGEAVDRRSDVFSLGIVLWELVTVRPLFHRRDEFETMTAINHEPVPRPSTVRADIPGALEAIIMKALSHAPSERYETADDMRRALEEFAAAFGIRTSTTALADYMKATFGSRRAPWLSRPATGEPDEPEIQVASSRVLPLPAPADEWDNEDAVVMTFAAGELDSAPVSAIEPPRRRARTLALPPEWRRRAPWLAGAVATLVLVLVMIAGGGVSPAAPSLSLSTPPTPAPITARVTESVPARAAGAPAPTAPPAPAKTTKRVAKPAAVKAHWNPNALFPN